MALTAEGRALTEAHRRGQIAIGADAEIAARALWSMLDPDDLDRTETAWMAASLNAMRPQYGQSVSLATAYVGEYRTAEGVAPGELARPRWDPALMAANLHLAGPVRVKLLVKGGMTGTAAHAGALTKFAGIQRRGVMSGGRMMIHETTKRDTRAIGWRRVTDGDPCTFCAMLASRGPVYGSRELAATTPGSGIMTGSPLRYHGHCGCTAEIVYGEWQPSIAEQVYIEEYYRAAAEVDALGLPRIEQNVLPRMRANGPFRDSPVTRNKTPSP